MTTGFVPPPYPYDRLEGLKATATAHADGRGLVDLSIGTPTDAPCQLVLDALAHSGAERGYPPSVGTTAFRNAASAAAIDARSSRQASSSATGTGRHPASVAPMA